MNEIIYKESRLFIVRILICINGLLLLRSGFVIGGIDILYLSLADLVLIPVPRTQNTIRNLIMALLVLLGFVLIIWGYCRTDVFQATVCMLVVLLGMFFVILRTRKYSVMPGTFRGN